MNLDSSEEHIERAIEKNMKRFGREDALLAEIDAKITLLTATNSKDYYRAQE